MAKFKLIDLSKIMFILITILAYQNFKIRDYQKILEADKIQQTQIESLQKNANSKKFLKPKEKIFQKNENLKNSILEITKSFKISPILFKEISSDKFELKFKINNEENFYSLLNKLRTELNGIVSFKEIKIKNSEKFLKVVLTCEIFYPQPNLQKYFYINRIDEEEFPEIFHLYKIKNYQLNGILHYDIAYINGKPYHEGDSVGGYKILKIYDDFIIAEKKKKEVKMKIDQTW